MSSIPSAAAQLRPPEQQPGPMEQYGNLLRLQAMKGQIANQPLQAEALQNQVHSGQLGIQLGQLQVQELQRQQASEQAIMDAYKQANGNLSQTLDIAAKSGNALPGDLIKLRQANLTMQSNALDLLNKQGAKAIQDADMYSGATDAVNKAPEADKPAVYQQQLQNLAAAGVDTSQVPPQYPGDQAFAQLHLGVQSHKAALAQALQTAQINSANSTIAKNDAEIKYYAQNGGAPGVPVEATQQADWIKKNPGKGPSDYKLWTLQHTPSAMIMGNMLSGPQNSDALDLAANNYRLTGQMPAGLYRSPGTTQAIIARAAELDKAAGGSGIAGNKAVLQANTKSLDNLQKNYDQVQAFEQTASKNFDLLQQTAQKIPDLGSRFANVPVRMLNARMLGTENMAAFNTALNTAQTEAAKVLNSSNATGVLSDSARHELQQIVDGNMPYKSIVASLNTLKQDMTNRTLSYQMQINDIQNRIKGAGGSNPSPGNGGTGLIIHRDANGRIIGVQ